MSKRNSKGQFVTTTGSTRYKKVQYKGTVMHESNRVMCVALGLDRIPKGMMVHHVDGDKKNNSLGNLALMNYKAHNVIHCTGRTPWNKGVSTDTNKKWSETIKKIHVKRKETFKKRFESTWELYLLGLTAKEISSIEGISDRQVYDRLSHMIS
jgi:hypothetical protein